MDVRIDSPLARGPSTVYVRSSGEGMPIVHLHGGWGYEIYPVQLAGSVVIPDRTGYGRSTPIAELPPRFHEAAAIETERLLDAMGIERPVIWGHSDGAVIAAILGLREPARYRGVVLEALSAGALWWADERLLVVADLHLEKGSSFARRGQLLPPYDTPETLARLGRLLDRFEPRDGRVHAATFVFALRQPDPA